MIGQTISHYRILEKLGEGGMGVVYKALDTDLDRHVALKFMPHHVTPDAAEEARFLQEAKAASALNHPNVCTIYGIRDEGGHRFIEMEYVEGRTLRQMNPVRSLADGLRYGIQIGDALHEAHVKGIVHRDIKADNIMVNVRDQVKVMDFGLAKLKGSLKITKAASTVGTLAYMAPEQIQGSDVDARSDIFSFGVVLYEMLTGRLPFRNEHEAALMYSILNDEPDQIQKYLPDVPPVLANLIHRALEKDRNDRHQSINEMVIELRRLQKQSTRVSRPSLGAMPASSDAGSGTSAGSSTTQTAAPAKRGKGALIGGIAAVLVALAAAWYFFLRAPSGVEINPAMTFRTLEVPFREIGIASLSRDGGWVAFPGNPRGASWDIFLMNTGSGGPRQITADSAGYMGTVDFSPDGSQIVYDRSDKNFTRPEIAVVSSLGGASTRIVRTGFNPRWRPDGKRIAYNIGPAWGSASGLLEIRSVDPDGSDDRVEFTLDDPSIQEYSWSPDGEAIAYPKRLGAANREIFIHDLASGSERAVTNLGAEILDLHWARDGNIIFSMEQAGGNNIWIVPSAGGTPVQITRGSEQNGTPSASAGLERILFRQNQPAGKLWLASLGTDDARPLTPDDADISEPAFAPDGRRIVYRKISRSTSGTTSNLVVFDRNDGQSTRIFSDKGSIHTPKWSPDGKWIAFAAHPLTVRHDSAEAFIIDPDNHSSARPVGRGVPLEWLDNRRFLTTSLVGTWVNSIDGKPVERIFRDSIAALPILDGAFIVYSRTVVGSDPGAWIEPAPGRPPGAPRQILNAIAPVQYVPGARAIYYVSPQHQLRRIALPAGKDNLVPGPDLGIRNDYSFDVSRDVRQITWADTKQLIRLVIIDNPILE